MEIPKKAMDEAMKVLEDIFDAPENEVMVLLEMLRYRNDPKKLTIPIPLMGDVMVALKTLEIVLATAPNEQMAEMIRTRILTVASTQRDKKNG